MHIFSHSSEQHKLNSVQAEMYWWSKTESEFVFQGLIFGCHGQHLLANKRSFLTPLLLPELEKQEAYLKQIGLMRIHCQSQTIILCLSPEHSLLKLYLVFFVKIKRCPRPGCKILLCNISSRWFQHNWCTWIKWNPYEDSALHPHHPDFHIHTDHIHFTSSLQCLWVAVIYKEENVIFTDDLAFLPWK